MTIDQYINSISNRYKLGNSTEHSFRGDLQQLIESLVPEIKATNEPKRQQCGAPDYIITRKEIPLGFIEAKDIGADLDNKLYKEQFDRYRQSLDNLIITDYLIFRLYRDSIFVTSITIGKVHGNKIIGIPEHYDEFVQLIREFCTWSGQTIKSASKLSKMMAAKARLLASVIEKALAPSESGSMLQEPGDITLSDQYQSFRQILIHDISIKSFADIYAQTIAYGMFAARLNDPSLVDFSRQEAAELIPKSNPFLRKLFQYIAGYDLDDRIKWIVDALADVFRATNVADLLKDFGKATQQNDPIVHFYETFLSEYDPALRKSRGVWYTPEPVVNFIVRAVDDILKEEFGLAGGLADTSKTKIKTIVQGQKIEQEVHKVQILDPAAGTGTFLAEIIKHIHKQFEGQQGIWNSYVEEHLIPRLNGFEILMASYAMAHLKLSLLLKDTGYIPKKEQRFRVYLTNSLEEYHPDTGTLFANWLSTEANEANRIKKDTPVMVVIGNPPYSGISSNKGEWISNLIEDYKYVDGVYFNERKHWLNDDYVKFIRYGQHFIEKNGSGILAFINPHGFLDNPTFRGMRWHLLKTFDKIYTIDLHGNSKKKETAPDGSADINVFDIMQGVSINIFLKTGKKKANELAKVFHFELYGKREMKYDFLSESSLKLVKFQELKTEKPFLFFVPKENKGSKEYEGGIRVNLLFTLNATGVVTARDGLVIDFDKTTLRQRMEVFSDINNNDDYIRGKFFGNKREGKYLAGDSRGWKMIEARKVIKNFNHNEIIKKIAYRIFDDRYIYYHSSMVDWGREKLMYNLAANDNLGIDLCRQIVSDVYSHIFITNKIVDDSFVSNKTRERGYVFPLYLYHETTEPKTVEQPIERVPNLNIDIVKQIADKLGLSFSSEKITTKDSFSPIDILDYIYAVLHSPTYREIYKEFLKIDFPRVPYPKDQNTFWKLVKLGGELRQIHLMESPVLNKLITKFPVTGSNEVEKVRFEPYDYSPTIPNEEGEIEYPEYLGLVYINDKQYFEDVPTSAWEFYIGGYQPAQKWLKDRKGRTLGFEDILHYQKIIVALTETDRLMKEIDLIEIE